MMKTDRDLLHYISENPELDNLLNELAQEASLKTIKWRHDKKAAKLHALALMLDKGLYGDYEGIKKYLKNNLIALEISGDILNINNGPLGGCPYRR